MSAASQLPAAEILPTSAQHFRLYVRFWDVVSVLLFSFATVYVIAENWGTLTWRHWAVAGLTAAQGVLYVVAIAGRSSVSNRRRAIYFVGGIGMWVAAGFIQPLVWWLGMAYFGQMLGLLPVRAAVVGSFIVNVLQQIPI
jgi:hypothetical protein